MEIIGNKNLSLVKRALLGHVVYCSIKAIRGSEKETEETWDPEIKDTEELIKSVELNLSRTENQSDGGSSFSDSRNG